MRERLLLAAALFLASCGSSGDPHCSIPRLDDEIRAAAGAGAVDCGHFTLGTDRKAVDGCVVAALAGAGAFHVRYELRGSDARRVFAVARSAAGTVTAFRYTGEFVGDPERPAFIVKATCDALARDPTSDSTDRLGPPPFECVGEKSAGRLCGG